MGVILILSVGVSSGALFTPIGSGPSNVAPSSGSGTSNGALFIPIGSVNNNRIIVIYEGSWTGAIDEDTGIHSVQGSGIQSFSLDENPGIVAAVFQKDDTGTGILSAEIIQGNQIVEFQSTSAEFGVVSVSHIF
jgi:hypothetical protein